MASSLWTLMDRLAHDPGAPMLFVASLDFKDGGSVDDRMLVVACGKLSPLLGAAEPSLGHAAVLWSSASSPSGLPPV